MLLPCKIAVTLLVLWMAISDIKARRIPNAIPFSLIAIACANSLVLREWPGFEEAGIVFLCGLPLFKTGLMGGGDVKALTAGAFLLPEKLPGLLALTSVAGGIVSIACLCWKFFMKKQYDGVPYGVAIGAGILTLAWF